MQRGVYLPGSYTGRNPAYLAPYSGGASGTTLTLSLADSADPVITGADAFSITADVTNTGSANATGVVMTITLDASLTYVSASGTGWSCVQSGGVVTCTANSALTPGAAPTVTVNVTTGTSGLTASTSGSVSAANAPTATDTETTVVNLVTKDATSGIYCPASSTEWTNFINRKALSVAVPSFLWLCQDSATPLADQIGGVTLAQTSTPSYQQTVSGWSRKFVTFPGGTTAQFSSVSASLPNISTTSFTACMYAAIPTPGTNTGVIGMGTTTTAKITALTTVHPRADSGANTATGTGNLGASAVIPWAIKVDRTNSNVTGYTIADKMVPTFSSGMTGVAFHLGPTSGNSVPQSICYAFGWSGTNAEISDANMKALYQALGWTPTWS